MSAEPGHEETLFRTSDDFLVWENYIKRCDTLDGLTPPEKEVAKHSLGYLSQVFGEHFLRRAYDQRERCNPHPLVQTIVMQAAWSRLWLIRFAQALQSLQMAPNFKGLLRRLRNPERFAEGESVLEVASQLVNAGFDVSFDPQVSVTRRDGKVRLKKPDMKIVSENTGEAIVEVSLLAQSHDFQQAQELTSFIIPLLFNHLSPAGLEMYAQMNERFDESRVTSTVNELLALIEQVKQTGKFATLENDCILAGIAPREDVDTLDQWADERAV